MKNSRIFEYREVLLNQWLPGEEIDRKMTLIEDFHQFMSQMDINQSLATVKESIEVYGRILIEANQNTPENFVILRSYAGWLGERKWYVAVIELMDCYKALGVLADEIERRHGSETRAWVFDQPLPSLGASEKERNAYTRRIMQRMAQRLSPNEVQSAWFQVQHGIPAAAWQEGDREDREKFRRAGSIDAYFDLKRQERDAMLTRLHDEHKLWYTQEISDEVLTYVKSDPEMEVGQRQGNEIYISKVPYNAVRYLRETDAKMKRYYACHCPLLRTAILEDLPISADACHCSLGHASHYLAGLGMQLKGEVLESAVKGDSRCRFVFSLNEAGGDA